MKKIFTILALSAGIFLTGCSAVPTATPEQKAQAINSGVPEGKSVVYVIRGEDDSYKGYIQTAEFNGKENWFYSKSFSKLIVEPGKIAIKLKSPVLIGGDAETTIYAKAGSYNYLEFSSHYRPIIGPGMEIKNLEEPVAKKMMNELNFVTNNKPQ